MLYNLSKEEIGRIRNAGFVAEFAGAEVLFAIFRTDSGVAAKILPKPLRPAPDSLAMAFVAQYPQTNFGCGYRESAVLLHAALGKETGLYAVSMPVDDDMAMIYGREIYGYPKKMAESVCLERSDSLITGSAYRKGAELIRIELKPNESAPRLDTGGVWKPSADQDGLPYFDSVFYLFKHFLSPDGKGFDYVPRLVRQNIHFKPRPGLIFGDGAVTLRSSQYDPLGEIPVESVVSCFYGTWDNTMLPGRVVSRAWNIFGFLPHAFFKTDMAPVLLRSD
jgi:acetoacetate decarboxylase